MIAAPSRRLKNVEAELRGSFPGCKIVRTAAIMRGPLTQLAAIEALTRGENVSIEVRDARGCYVLTKNIEGAL